MKVLLLTPQCLVDGDSFKTDVITHKHRTLGEHTGVVMVTVVCLRPRVSAYCDSPGQVRSVPLVTLHCHQTSDITCACHVM